MLKVTYVENLIADKLNIFGLYQQWTNETNTKQNWGVEFSFNSLMVHALNIKCDALCPGVIQELCFLSLQSSKYFISNHSLLPGLGYCFGFNV